MLRKWFLGRGKIFVKRLNGTKSREARLAATKPRAIWDVYITLVVSREMNSKTKPIDDLTDSSVSETSSNGGDDFQNQLAEDRKSVRTVSTRRRERSGPGANNVAMCYEEGQKALNRLN